MKKNHYALYLCLVLLILNNSCKPKNPTAHDVRYETKAVIPYEIIYTNEKGIMDTFLKTAGPWYCEFKATAPLKLFIKAQLPPNVNSSASLTTKIYIDGSLWKLATGNTEVFCQDDLPN
jgi:hypothetical protein